MCERAKGRPRLRKDGEAFPATRPKDVHVMKLGGKIGWSLGLGSFLFTAYVSLTGGPDLSTLKWSSEKERARQIAASATEVHEAGCCTKKGQPKPGCCPHHARDSEKAAAEAKAP